MQNDNETAVNEKETVVEEKGNSKSTNKKLFITSIVLLVLSIICLGLGFLVYRAIGNAKPTGGEDDGTQAFAYFITILLMILPLLIFILASGICSISNIVINVILIKRKVEEKKKYAIICIVISVVITIFNAIMAFLSFK